MLKKKMQSRNLDEEDEEDLVKPTQLSYNELSSGCSRRTHAGVFFELLQLKTWDFVDLNQHENDGDIIITPGLRFNESPDTDTSDNTKDNQAMDNQAIDDEHSVAPDVITDFSSTTQLQF